MLKMDFAGLNDDVAARIVSFCDVGSVSALFAASTTFRTRLHGHWAACKSALRIFGADPELSITRLQSSGRLAADDTSVARFLYDAHGRLPAKAVGRFLTAPPPPSFNSDATGGTHTDLARESTLDAYLRQFDFFGESPPQALRRLLAHTRMPSRTKGAGELFHAAARRYAECWQRPPAALGSGERPHVHGYDVSAMGHDAVFVLIYTLYILNADLRSAAIKTKMTRSAFVALNTGVEALRSCPPAFFDGLYGEIVAEGLPVSDTVPVAPVAATTTASAVVRMLQPLVGTLAEHAGGALSWLRRTAAAALPAHVVPVAVV